MVGSRPVRSDRQIQLMGAAAGCRRRIGDCAFDPGFGRPCPGRDLSGPGTLHRRRLRAGARPGVRGDADRLRVRSSDAGFEDVLGFNLGIEAFHLLVIPAAMPLATPLATPPAWSFSASPLPSQKTTEIRTLLAEHHLAAVKKCYEPESPARDPSIHAMPWPMPSLALRALFSRPRRHVDGSGRRRCFAGGVRRGVSKSEKAKSEDPPHPRAGDGSVRIVVRLPCAWTRCHAWSSNI